jgi:hypothetical protein
VGFIRLHPGIFHLEIGRVKLLVRIELLQVRIGGGEIGKTIGEKLFLFVEIMQDELAL